VLPGSHEPTAEGNPPWRGRPGPYRYLPVERTDRRRVVLIAGNGYFRVILKNVRRGEPVHATDGDIGKVQGLAIDPGSRHMTHVLLQEGHLWGRKKVAIPVSAVASTGDGIRLTIDKHEVQDLPPADIDHPDLSTGGTDA
jgi:PRC-barrel domain